MANEIATTSSAKRTAIELGAGALLGLVLSSLGGPALISLWYQPPSGNAFSCAGSVQEALSKFVTFQVSCALVGAAVIALAFFFGRRALANRRKASA